MDLDGQGPSGPDDPRVLDPFAGSGSIAAEATRLGCKVYALDLNPLSFHILKAALEYPVTLGKASNDSPGTSAADHWNGLADEIQFWAMRVRALATPRLALLYPSVDSKTKGSPSGYLWLQTTTCDACGASYPVRRRMAVSRMDDGTQVVSVEGDPNSYQVHVETVKEVDSQGTANAQCPKCRWATDSPKFGPPILIAVATGGGAKPQFLTATSATAEMMAPWQEAHAKRLAELLTGMIGSDLKKALPSSAYASPIRRGAESFADLFSQRQLLAGLEYCQAITEAEAEMRSRHMADDHVLAIRTYLAFLIGYLVDRNSLGCVWHHSPPRVSNTFERPAFVSSPLFVEQPPHNLVESWCRGIQQQVRCAEALPRASQVALGSATQLPYSDEYFDAIVTDPPFFDRVQYAELSDFYGVWERSFWAKNTSATSNEAVISASAGGFPEFQTHFSRAVSEMFRVLKQGRVFTMLLTSRIKEHFEAYITTAQECGFELLNVKSITESRHLSSNPLAITAIACFRKPFQNMQRSTLGADAEVTLKAAEQNRPVLYPALAELLIEELDPQDLAEFIPANAKGTKAEMLMEVLADLDPRQLIRDSLGRSGVRRVATRFGVGGEKEPPERLVDKVLQHFGFTVPVAEADSNPSIALDRLRKLRNRILQSREKSELRGAFLEVSTTVERMTTLAVFGWARALFENDWRKTLVGLLPAGHRGLEKLTFGDLLVLFKALPDAGVESVQRRGLIGKVGGLHVYRPKRYNARLDGILSARNKVEHDRDGYWSTGSISALATDLQRAADEASVVIADLVAERALPRIARATKETRDEWNRTMYTLLLDDGCEKEISLSYPLKLGKNYLYFGTATNPRPVDPILIAVDEQSD